jgi:hypothetical protein
MIEFLKHPYAKIILGILWGFGLSCLFAKSCNNRNCIIMKPPKNSDVDDKIFGQDEKCYRFVTVNTQCPLGIPTIEE